MVCLNGQNSMDLAKTFSWAWRHNWCDVFGGRGLLAQRRPLQYFKTSAPKLGWTYDSKNWHTYVSWQNLQNILLGPSSKMHRKWDNQQKLAILGKFAVLASGGSRLKRQISWTQDWYFLKLHKMEMSCCALGEFLTRGWAVIWPQTTCVKEKNRKIWSYLKHKRFNLKSEWL